MRVLWVSHSAAAFGAERAMIEGAAAVSKLGANVHLVLPPHRDRGAVWGELELPRETISLPWWVRPLSLAGLSQYAAFTYYLPKSIWALLTLMRTIRPDVVVTNSIVIPSAAVAAKCAGVPHVWYVHEFGDKDHKLKFLLGRSASLKLVDALSAVVLVNGPAVLDHLRPYVPLHKLRTASYACDSPQVPAATKVDESLDLVMVGRLAPTKGQADAIRATARLKHTGLPARLTIVGPGSPEYRRELVALAEQLGVSKSVDFISETTEPSAFVKRADISLMCSTNEAFGRVTIEAMKCGVPVIGARSGGTAYLIKDWFNGLLYEPGNDEDLASKILSLAERKTAWASMRANAQKWALAEFNPGKFGAELMAAFTAARG